MLPRFQCWLACAALAYFAVPSAYAQAGFTWKYEPRSLEAADRYGYAIWTVPLAALPLDGATIPLRAEFSTDLRPSPAPSPLGWGWSVNFFSSALVEVDQDSIRWHRPDGRIFFFNLERGDSSASKRGSGDPIVFKSKDGSWVATKLPRKRFITLVHRESGAEFIYEDGLLVRFSFSSAAKGAERYSIIYNRLRLPVRLTVLGSGKPIAEFAYGNDAQAKSLSIVAINNSAPKVVELEYTPAALNQFGSGPYLERIGGATHVALKISYVNEGHEANRVSFERINTGGTSSLVWEAKTGFIREDEGGTYKIENPSLENGGKLAVKKDSKAQVMDYNWRPDDAKVTRIDRAGKSESRFYDRARGVLTQRDATGSTTATSYLLTPGPMYGKVRKITETTGTVTRILEQNAFDEKGRLVRKITSDGDILIHEYVDQIGMRREILNGKIIKETQSLPDRTEVTKYTRDGVYLLKIKEIESGESHEYYRDGRRLWIKHFDLKGALVFYENALGESLVLTSEQTQKLITK